MPSNFSSRSVLAVVCAAASLAGRAHAQTPQLVTDVDPATGPSYIGRPTQLTAGSGPIFFFGTTSSGRGLLRAQGSGEPTLVRQLVDEGGSAELFRAMATSGDRVFFTAESGLWVSDGTPFGTAMVRSFAPGSVGAQIVDANGILFFLASGGLWKSDGTSSGTVFVAPATVFPGSLVASGSRVFFRSVDDALWTSDGTAVGTLRVGQPVAISANVATPVVPFGGGVLFVSSQRELWRSDGTEAGTVRVGAVTLVTGNLTSFDSATYFSTTTALWKTDGTDAGTVLVEPNVAVLAMHAAEDVLYFHGQQAASGHELWTSDGTEAGTGSLELCPGPCSFLTGFTFFARLPGGVAFARHGARDIWRTDGTTTGTVLLASNFPHTVSLGSEVHSLTAAGGSAYFVAGDGVTGGQGETLWSTDGTPAGTARVVMGTGGHSSSPLFEGSAGERAVFAATRPDVGRELWSTTGTPASTELVDLAPGPAVARWKGVASLDEAFLFARIEPEGVNSLWTTDGTAAGTAQLPVSPDGWRAAAASGVAVVGDSLDPSDRLHRTDGTVAGTFDVPPPESGSDVVLSRDDAALTAWGNEFAATMFNLSFQPSAIWLTDGTQQAREVTIGTDGCKWSVPADERLFVFCDPGGSPSLWVTDGTYGGTRLVTALAAAPLSGGVGLDGHVYFRLPSPAGPVLWRSDGTAAGTMPLPSSSAAPVDVSPLTLSNGILYFAGATAAAGRELWRTDGTADGTFMLRDIDAGAASGIVWPQAGPPGILWPPGPGASIVAHGGGVIFAARTSANGVELWRSNGTTKGTLPLAEIAAGPASSEPGSMRALAGRLYFAAWDAAHGREPWRLELPPVGVVVADVRIDEGDAGTTPVAFPVRLGAAAPVPVTVAYETVAGTAQAGSDFVAASGVLTFAPGTLERTVEVAVVGDLVDESNESFSLRVTSAVGASIADGRGTVVVVDDDMPRLAAGGASVVEGDAGESQAAFPVTLTTSDGQPSTGPILVRTQVTPVTASANDFPPFSSGGPTLSFPAGTASGTTLSLLVPVRGDTFDEPNETFQVSLDTQNDATVETPVVGGVILDDDGLPSGAPTEIAHGSRVLTDLAAPVGGGPAADFYVLKENPFASYEVVLDAVSGDAVPLLVERVSSSGAVVQTAEPSGAGGSVRMSWLGSGAPDQHLRVSSPGCGTTCGPDDVYRLRMYETTLTGARVNNTGSQVTIAILHNPTDRPVQASIALWFYSDFATVLPIAIEPRGSAVVDIDAILPDFSGSLIVTHDAPYGTVNGKVITLDAVTGFSFESALASKPR